MFQNPYDAIDPPNPYGNAPRVLVPEGPKTATPQPRDLERKTRVETETLTQTAPYAAPKAKADAAKAQAEAAAAARKAHDDALHDRVRKASALLNTDSVLSAIQEARGHIGPHTTGMLGSVLKHIAPLPGVENGDAYQLARNLDTIKGNVAFDRYSQLKENLPEGAQGGVRLTDQETRLLAGLQGSLDQGQDEPTVRKRLYQIEQRYRQNAALASGLDPFDPKVMRSFGIQPKQQQAGPKVPRGWKVEVMP